MKNLRDKNDEKPDNFDTDITTVFEYSSLENKYFVFKRFCKIIPKNALIITNDYFELQALNTIKRKNKTIHIIHSSGEYNFENVKKYQGIIDTIVSVSKYIKNKAIETVGKEKIKHEYISQPVPNNNVTRKINKEKTEESEQKVYITSKNEISKCKNFAIVDFNFKDVDRFKTFYNISKEVNRKLVISFKHVCFLEKYHLDRKLNVVDSRDENLMILKPKLATGTYDDGDYSNYKYIKNRLDYPNIITAEEIKKRPEKYLLILNYWYLNTLIDLKPEGGLYVHSLSEPFNEEMEFSFKRMKNWLNYFNLRFFQSHCSGHASGSELKEIIKKIKPKVLYPIHTEHPGMFRRLNTKSVLIKEGKRYNL